MVNGILIIHAYLHRLLFINGTWNIETADRIPDVIY